MARQFLVATNNWSGTDRRWLDEVGIVTNVVFKSMYPGGPSLLTCTLNMPAISAPLVVQSGRKVEVFNGAKLCWAGRLDDPKRGEPWELSATGIGSLATSYSANSGTANTAVDNAISRGLPWTRPASLGTAFKTTLGDGSQSLAQALTTSGTAGGGAWKVSPDGVVSGETWPTAVTHLAYPVNVPPTSLSAYYTAVVIQYGAVGAYSTTTVTNAAAAARYGYVEGRLDLTAMGSISSLNAQTYGQQWLNRQSPMLTLTGPVVVMPGQLLTVQGAAVDLASVRAGIFVRIMTTDPGHSQLVDATQPIEGVVIETAYDSTAETLSLSLQGEQRRDLVALMADAYRNSLYQRA